MDEQVPVPATREELEWFHTADYLDTIRSAEQGVVSVKSVAAGLGTPDCPVFKGMYDFVALACGATITGARLLAAGDACVAFNPSGGFHHAAAARASGFCYMNDIVLAARVLTSAGKRVAFVDIDVHHGDGVQEAFYDRSDVMTLSMHESGKALFPGTGSEREIGRGAGRGYSINVPLPAGTGDEPYRKAFESVVFPLLSAYDPDVIILELGMDALACDPLAHLRLTNNVHADIIAGIRTLDKPILATGGGGYNVPNTVRGWALCWSVLCGEHSMHDDMSFGMGGVMLENTDWAGGLRDRVLLADGGRHDSIRTEIDRVLDAVRAAVFPMHRL